MASPLDCFDRLCRQVFFPSSADDTNSNSISSTAPAPVLVSPSNEETALSLLSRAQVYELPASYTLPPTIAASMTSTTTPTSTETSSLSKNQDRLFYRIHLETVEDPPLQQQVRNILMNSIDEASLVELPFDRNLSGYSSKSRTETREATLESPVVLDMGDLSEQPGIGIAATTIPLAQDASIHDTHRTMLLVPMQEWLRMSGRIRFWRAESHRVKAAQREIVLNELLNERWRTATSSTSNLPSFASAAAISSPPPSSGSLVAAAIPPTSLSSPATSSTSSSPANSPRSSTISQGSTAPVLRPSPYKQSFQGPQLDSLVQFMSLYGDEPSATSILRGVLDLVRKQLTQEKVLTWTFDRANLTEQKPEVTVAFLDLIARLGMELVENKGSPSVPPPLIAASSFSSAVSESTVVVVAADGSIAVGVDAVKETRSTELTWTFGPRADDRRLEYWIQYIQQEKLPVLQTDDQSLLPSNVTSDSTAGSHNNGFNSHLGQGQKPNPIPVAIRKRFLHDRKTIPAGSIQVFTTSTTSASSSRQAVAVIRERVFVLGSSKYALSGGDSSLSSSSSGMFVDKVRKDVKYLARWASTCGGRLDWIWTWLFASFHKSRHGSSSSSASERRPPRSNDENV